MPRLESWGRVSHRLLYGIVALVCVSTIALVAVGGISAAPIQLGGAAPGGGTCAPGFWHAQIGQATVSYTAPAGVWRLTSWSMAGSSGSVSFLVLRLAGGTAHTVVYASPAHSLTGGINTFADSVAVLGGDEIAFGANSTVPGCFVGTGNPADSVGWNFQPFSVGSVVDPAAPPAGCNGCISGFRWNLGATLEPITKGDCKDGGWADWHVFKNQGDCVSFVASGGKNGPAGASTRG
jgi:hypothetical protein